jgi:23S rRNA (cytosine1962-C5)-methyltransferase
MAVVTLKKNRERSLRRRHPWIFSGAIASVEGAPNAGDIVRVLDHAGNTVAWGYYNAQSQIQVRVLDWQPEAVVDEDWWHARLKRAIEWRRALPMLRDADAVRLVYAEADGLPGLIVDRYGDTVVVQALTAGIERVKPILSEMLVELAQPRCLYERSDADARKIEGLPPATGPLHGDAPARLIEINEGKCRFLVDVAAGHKTGFYLDQRENRAAVSCYAQSRTLLDLFSYSGGFAVHALRNGAERATLVESSPAALELERRHAAINDIEAERLEMVGGNVFDVVRAYRGTGRTFDMVVCDPPKFAPTRQQLPKAERAYKDVNLMAMRLLEPGGILVTFSCSGALSVEEFSRIIAWASLDAGRDVQILQRLAQASDHPVDPRFPESEYLKGLVCRVV